MWSLEFITAIPLCLISNTLDFVCWDLCKGTTTFPLTRLLFDVFQEHSETCISWSFRQDEPMA